MRRTWIVVVVLLGGGFVAYIGWTSLQPKKLPDGFAGSNGRIEAVEIDIAAKTPGRLKEVLVDEGDFVAVGQILARMDTEVLAAQLREAQADLRRAKSAVDSAASSVTQREREKSAGESLVAQREAELDGAKRNRARAEDASAKGVGSAEALDAARVQFFSADAAVKVAKANVAASDAAITTAKSQVIQAEAAVDAAKSRIERLQAEIEDCTLKAPRDGRVQYRVAQPGEVLTAGGKVLNMVDLADVYMTFFLPTAEAGRVRMGTDVHLVLDASPQFVLPARVTYVADVAQFTPKTVETAQEREKLVFRIKARIDPELLKKHIKRVKTGLPGVAYVQLDPQAEWPANLRLRVPE
ncbi:MAG: HlyD family efflux transporter periplasmic adaptor subunit [Planctomycetes bacterium]|nr:HlyD family efflux transporter periplasmic adaptor subunit [Planctomycetota bacterium]